MMFAKPPSSLYGSSFDPSLPFQAAAPPRPLPCAGQHCSARPACTTAGPGQGTILGHPGALGVLKTMMVNDGNHDGSQ